MKLFFSGHQETYAVEQTLLTLFPEERPEYPDTLPGGENELELSLHRGDTWTTAIGLLRYGGKTVRRRSRIRTALLEEADPVEATRLRRRLLQRTFYLVAAICLDREPPWGMLSGVRPVKIPTRALEEGATEAQAEAQLRVTYRVSPLRRRLAMDCARAALAVKRGLGDQELSLYAGIPFCPTRCAYCSFISASGAANKLLPDYLTALLREIDAAGQAAGRARRQIKSVYLGGGTPTVLSADQLALLLDRLQAAFAPAPFTEITLEAGRPDTITREKLLALKGRGVTRLSVNPQTLSDPVLAAIGRQHRAEDVYRAYELVRETGDWAVNMDLIAGLPGDTPSGFQKTLEAVLALGPENITVHTLALKRGARLRQEAAPLPPAQAVGEMLAFAWPALREAGYLPYYLYRQKFTAGGFENVGWAKPGFFSVYNICMMEELHTVLSLGAGGVTKFVTPGKVRRLANPKYPQEYLRDIDRICTEKANLVFD